MNTAAACRQAASCPYRDLILCTVCVWLTCLPPPLLGWALEDIDGPDAPPLPLLFPVQLLHRISPWFPFFHIDDEFVLQTAQHGFKPSGIFSGHETWNDARAGKENDAQCLVSTQWEVEKEAVAAEAAVEPTLVSSTPLLSRRLARTHGYDDNNDIKLHETWSIVCLYD